MEKKSRVRAPNYTTSDNLLLCDIVTKHKRVIENKQTDGANLMQKQSAWLEVAREYNSTTSGYSRTLESLQQNYKNLKRKAKKNVSSSKMDIPVDKATLIQSIEAHGTSSSGWENVAKCVGASESSCQKTYEALCKAAKTQDKKFKKNIMGTGGGPPAKFEEDPLLEKVKVLVGPSMDGMFTVYDGDSSLMALQNVEPIEAKNMFAGEGTSQAIEQQIDVLNTSFMMTQDEVKVDDIEDVYKNLDSEESFFTNDRANLKKKPHTLITRKRKLEMQVPVKQTVAEKFKILASEKMQLVKLQQEVVRTQLQEEKEKLEHNRLLRGMEIENLTKTYEHSEIIRKLELNKLMNNTK